MEPVQLRIRNSGSYYYTFTGSKYFEQYNQKTPLYMYSHQSGSTDDYLFNSDESKLLQSYNSINSISIELLNLLNLLNIINPYIYPMTAV